MPIYRRLLLSCCFLILFGCANQQTTQELEQGEKQSDTSTSHLGLTQDSTAEQPPASDDTTSQPGSIPSHVAVTASLPEPKEVLSEATHTVVVYDVPVAELLFSLARDSELNFDIDPGIDGTVSLNAIEQPLTAILNRIAEVADIRYEINNNVLRVRQDAPYIQSYAIDYLNISRTSFGSVAVSTEISSTGQGADPENSEAADAGNSSNTLVENISENAFWSSLERNIGQILNNSSGDESTSDENPDIIVNRESGTLAVRASQRQHIDIKKFIDQVQGSTQRQVLIEATIAEVNLSETYQAGIDWALISPNASSSLTASQNLTEVDLANPPTFSLSLSDLDIAGGNQLQATLRALETFGDVSVMSSPKVMAMNNQTALLKVVDNLIYFTVEVTVDTSGGTLGGGTLTTFDTDINTVPVGFVMSVTPFINETGGVTLNVRPTISRVISFARDPNPALADANVVSEIPVIQVREVESILRVESGEVAIIGGLMQDEIKRNNRGVPVLSKMPIVGKAFDYDSNETNKTELVIFLKPTVIQRGTSINQGPNTVNFNGTSQ